ncbi:MAG TPA: ABC transporter permease [Cyclobacteriaceae bacterium]|nr:ABC transporter permease [Cyclobacteriaceae bacterium]
MIGHYFTIIYRNFLRAKGYFLINLFGLSAGMMCTLLIYLWVKDELGMNKFHANDANLYQVMEHQKYSDRIMTTNSIPGILSENLKIEFPEVEYAATTTWINDNTLSIKDHNIKARGWDVGPEFFHIFSYKLVQGSPETVLKDQMSMVISRSLAVRLFGTDENVIGKTVELNHDKSLNITGVFEDTPNTSSYRFDFVLSFELYKTENEWVKEWGNNGPSSYIVLKNGSDPVAFENKIKDYIKGKEPDTHITLFVQKFSDLYLFGSWENGQQSGGRIEYVKLFSIIAIFILVIACINFMNLSTARATRKSKEVGIKKSVGAGRQSLIFQYMSESLLTTFLSLILSLGVVYVFLPAFNLITDKHIRLDLTDPMLLLWLLGVTIVTGLLAGSYPALYLSGFKPAAVLKGDVKGSLGELWARKGLVVFQFFLSVILIVCVIVIYKQIEFVQTQSLGYEKDNLIRFPAEGQISKNKDGFLKELRRIPGVKNASSIGHGLLGQNNNTSGLQWEGKDPDELILFENVSANDGLFETLGITFVEGKPFQDGTLADTSKIIFNEAGIEAMGLTDPIGKHIRLWESHDMEIIGVVKNFNFQSMHDPVKPLFFRLNPPNTWNIMVRLEAGKEKETLAAIGKMYSSFNPGFSFEYKFQNDEYALLYAAEQRVATLSSYFASMAVVISCLGLFGLAAFTAERRLKEIGIRKALGSSSTSIVLLLSGDFTKMVLVAVLLGLPVGYWFIDKWLADFAFRIPLSLTYFAGAGVAALTIAWLTVASQAIKASRVNPVKCLRTE